MRCRARRAGPRDGGRVDVDRRGRLEPALDPVEPGGDQPAERQVRVAAGVGGLELGVGRRLLGAGEGRRHPHRRLAVVVAPADERAGPELGHDAVVGVEARSGQAAEAGEVLEHAGDERAGRGGEPVGRAAVVEAVAVAVPEREVDVAAVAGVVGPRLGRQRGDEPPAGGDGADGLAHEQLLVGGPERGCVRGRDLVLPVAELGVVLLDRNALRLQRGDEVVDVVLRRGGPDGREAQRRVDGDVGAVPLGRERELALERRAQRQVVGGQRRLHALQERALADRGGRPLAGEVIGQHRSGVGRVGQDAERVEVGHEPELAHRPQRGDGLQLVECADRLHGHREPDAGAQPSLEAVAPGRLGPHGAVVPAPQEAEEAQAGLIELRDDVVDAHARRASRRRGRCRDPAAAASGSRRGRSRPSRRARRCAGGAARAR